MSQETHTMTGPVMHSLSRVKEWDMNPRDVYDADRQLMVNSLLEVGFLPLPAAGPRAHGGAEC
jgi:hypothetical protein